MAGKQKGPRSRRDLTTVNRRAAPSLRRIDLTESGGDRLFEREIRDVLLTGRLKSCRPQKACNMVRSVLDQVSGEDLDLQGCDFKDTAIRDSEFFRSHFGHSSWHYNAVSDTRFAACSFAEMSMQHCDFDRVTFSECDLRNNVVKSCRFSQCTFVDCATNNKLFETSRFAECDFRGTELQVQTLAENFGLTSSRYDGAVRSDRGDEPHQKLTRAGLKHWLSTSREHPLNKVNVEYFLQETLLAGSTHLDEAASLSSWLPMFRTAGSFTVVLSQWTDFLLWLYPRGQVTMHTLLAFHGMTDELIRTLEAKAPGQSILADLSGAHLALSRAVDAYLEVLEACTNQSPDSVCLLVEGHSMPEYYYRSLAPFFSESKASIVRLVPHNSPWELTVTFGSATGALLFFAMFLATRTSLELTRIREGAVAGLGRRRKATLDKQDVPELTNLEPSDRIFSLSLGGALINDRSPGLRLRAYLPGNLLAEFRLAISSRQVAKFRRILKEVL